MGLAIGIIVVLLVILELWFWLSLRRRSAEKKLAKLCFGDAAQVDRLVAREQKRNPRLTRAQAVRAALESYRRDNR